MFSQIIGCYYEFGPGIIEPVIFSGVTGVVGLLNLKTRPTLWPFGFALCFLVGALVTPADPASMFWVAIPLSVAYGLGILVGKSLPGKKQAE